MIEKLPVLTEKIYDVDFFDYDNADSSITFLHYQLRDAQLKINELVEDRNKKDAKAREDAKSWKTAVPIGIVLGLIIWYLLSKLL